MPISQKGAIYKSREGIQNPPTSLRELARHLLNAFDDIASQLQAVRTQGNYGQQTSPAAPHPVNAIAVVNSGGFAQITLTHNNPPAGTRYVIEYSTTPNFQSGTVQRADNGISLTWERYLHGKTLFFRAAPMFLSSAVGSWIYFGGAANPTAVVF